MFATPSLNIPWPVAERRSIVPVFLPFRGCPVRCVFCAQDAATGRRADSALPPLLAALRATLEQRAVEGKTPAELAFFGGTFTALPPEELKACLSFATASKADGLISGFRCSTRPDSVSRPVLNMLLEAGCSTVELGVQSFADKSLHCCARGYGRSEALAGCAAVKGAGLRLGVQLLPGLPEGTPEMFLDDVRLALALGADMLRFYPCLVLAGTALADIWRCGGYRPWDMATTLDALARGWLLARAAGTPVIRMGLAPEPALTASILDGPAHPALGSRVMGKALFLAVREMLDSHGLKAAAQLEAPMRTRGCFWGHAGELRPQWLSLGLDGKNVAFSPAMEVRVWPLWMSGHAVF